MSLQVHDTYEFFAKGIPFLSIGLWIALFLVVTFLGMQSYHRRTSHGVEWLTANALIVGSCLLLYFFTMARTYLGYGPAPSWIYDGLRIVAGYCALLGLPILIRHTVTFIKAEHAYWIDRIAVWRRRHERSAD
jgi:hypothetical protein